jgi:hypothetical protein
MGSRRTRGVADAQRRGGLSDQQAVHDSVWRVAPCVKPTAGSTGRSEDDGDVAFGGCHEDLSEPNAVEKCQRRT